MADAIAALEGVVRDEAARTELGTPASTELLASLDALTTARRVRLAAATRDIPALYVVTLVASGLVLVANAGVLTFRSGARASLLIMGLAGVVGLSLALLFALTGPWHGALAVSGDPIDDVSATSTAASSARADGEVGPGPAPTGGRPPRRTGRVSVEADELAAPGR